MLLMPNEVEQKKREQGAALVDTRSPEDALASLLTSPAVPLSPWQKAEKEYGTGEAVMRRLGNILTGGLFDDALIPEMGTGSQALYKEQLESYVDQATAYQQMQALTDIDPSQLTPQHIALGNELGGSAFGGYLTDMYAAQQSGLGGDEEIASHFGYDAYQWNQLSPEKRRDLSDRYAYEKGGEDAFDYRLNAEGKAPEQLQDAKEAELYGSGLGQQLADDRQIITGAQSQIEMLDASAAKIKGIREILEENPDATGWNRIFRDIFNVNTETDGVLSEAEASGVVEQIKQATFGAISQAELDLLRQALMDPSKSSEFNIGTLSAALKTVQDKRKQTISAGQQAVDRYSASDTQNDFESLMKSDWAYNNIGAGSRVPSIPAFGGAGEYTYQQYVKDTLESLGPFDPKPSRDELLIGFAKEREQAEAEYNAMIEKQKADADAAQKARLGLDRPWPTVKQ